MFFQLLLAAHPETLGRKMVSIIRTGVKTRILLRRKWLFRSAASALLLLLVPIGYFATVQGNNGPLPAFNQPDATSSLDLTTMYTSAVQNASFSQSVVAALEQEVYGDQNGDGVVNIADVVVGMQIASDGVEPTSIQIALNNLKNDDTIDAADAMITLQHIASAAASLDKLRTVTIQDAEGTVGDDDPITLEVTLNDMTSGASGFDLMISIENASKATINQVKHPNYGFPPLISPLTPSSTVKIRVVDFNDILSGPFSRQVIATLEVELLSDGETQIVVGLIRLDGPNPDGFNLVPGTIRQNGTLVVNAAPQ